MPRKLSCTNISEHSPLCSFLNYIAYLSYSYFLDGLVLRAIKAYAAAAAAAAAGALENTWHHWTIIVLNLSFGAYIMALYTLTEKKRPYTLCTEIRYEKDETSMFV